jgi:hypothetical protein
VRFDIEPGGPVVLGLLDEEGTIRVKLGADRSGSGMVLLDERTEPEIQLIARQAPASQAPATTSLILSGSAGRSRTIEP